MKSMLGFYVLFYKYLTKNIYKIFSLAFNKYASEQLTWCYPAKSDICKWIPLVLRWQMTEGIYLFVKPFVRNGIKQTASKER